VTVPGRAPLVVASNRGPLSVVAVGEGDDKVQRGSRETGAARTLGHDALYVNPFDVTATAEALHTALTLPAADRCARAARMRAAAVECPPAAWFQAQLDALD
jgi:trehalose-6-phosphate synthase